MKMLSPDSFFDRKFSKHQLLFDHEYVWEILSQIKPYLKSLPLGKIEGDVSTGATLINPELITIGKGSVVEAGAYIIGPCFIGENCEIRHGAYIRGDVIAEDHSIIGHASEIKSSWLLKGAKAGHFAYVGDSILGVNSNLGAGTKLANLRFDGKEITIKFEGKKINTNLRKFGAILGDGALTGCNSVTNPGTLMQKGKTCLPCQNIGGFY